MKTTNLKAPIVLLTIVLINVSCSYKRHHVAERSAEGTKQWSQRDNRDMRRHKGAVKRKMVPAHNSEIVFEIPQKNTESYAYSEENDFKNPLDEPLSTFSIDVDAASFTNCRHYLKSNTKPPEGAVRVEEFINYFDYNYEQPENGAFSIYTEHHPCPWNEKNILLQIGIQGKRIPFEELPPLNLVFLVDISGSMGAENKLPLVKKSLNKLCNQLRAKDHISLVVYAGATGVVLKATSGDQKEKIKRAINGLGSGGSTAGASGLKLAYSEAAKNKTRNSINRIILATDGDFNIGPSSDAEMTKMVEKERNENIYITALGFGMGNFKDSKLEAIADHGNGNYFYIDDLSEAQRVLVNNLSATVYTIAKDVKIQIEFNSAHVSEYRLIGYTNRLLDSQDFDDDKKDAGELGAGHNVTALYELVSASDHGSKEAHQLKYHNTVSLNHEHSKELCHIKFRYKHPKDTTSKLIEHSVKAGPGTKMSERFKLASSVAAFAQYIHQSKYLGKYGLDQIATNVKGITLPDPETQLPELAIMIKQARHLYND